MQGVRTWRRRRNECPQIKAKKEKSELKNKRKENKRRVGHTIQNKTTQVGKKHNNI